MRLQSEERAIRNSILNGKFRGRIHLDVLPAATIDDLARTLLSKSFDVIHFSGHADRNGHLTRFILDLFTKKHGPEAFDHLRSDPVALERIRGEVEKLIGKVEHNCAGYADDASLAILSDLLQGTHSISIPALVRTPSASDAHRDLGVSCQVSVQQLVEMGTGSLALENEGGEASFLRPQDLASLLCAYAPLKVLLLNACGSALHGHIVSQVAPMTVCVGRKISDPEAVNFSRGFYEALGEGIAFERSFQQGMFRVAVHSLDAGVPPRPSSPFLSLAPSPTPTLPHAHPSPLLRFIKNQELIAHLTSETSSVSLPAAAPSSPYGPVPLLPDDATVATATCQQNQRGELHRLQEANAQLTSRVTELEGVVRYGVGLVKQKDQEILRLHELLALMAQSSAAPAPVTSSLTSSSPQTSRSRHKYRFQIENISSPAPPAASPTTVAALSRQFSPSLPQPQFSSSLTGGLRRRLASSRRMGMRPTTVRLRPKPEPEPKSQISPLGSSSPHAVTSDPTLGLEPAPFLSSAPRFPSEQSAHPHGEPSAAAEPPFPRDIPRPTRASRAQRHAKIALSPAPPSRLAAFKEMVRASTNSSSSSSSRPSSLPSGPRAAHHAGDSGDRRKSSRKAKDRSLSGGRKLSSSFASQVPRFSDDSKRLVAITYHSTKAKRNIPPPPPPPAPLASSSSSSSSRLHSPVSQKVSIGGGPLEERKGDPFQAGPDPDPDDFALDAASEGGGVVSALPAAPPTPPPCAVTTPSPSFDSSVLILPNAGVMYTQGRRLRTTPA